MSTEARLVPLARVGGAVVTVAALGGVLASLLVPEIEDTTTRSFALSLPAGERLEVDAQAADVRVREVPAGTAPAAVLHSSADGIKPTWSLSRNRVTSSCPTQWAVLQHCDLRWEITVPEGTPVVIAAESGDITLDGLGGAVTAETSSGDIEVLRSRSAALSLTASSGDVGATAASAPTALDAQTASGDVRLELPGGTAYRVDTATSSGEVTNRLGSDPASTHAVTARTASGDITITRS